MDTLDLRGAAAFLHLHPHTLQERAKAGIVKGAKPGRRWVFLEADLEAYLRGLQEEQYRSTSAETPGGSTSGIVDDEYDAALARAIASARASSTTPSVPSSTGSSRIVALSTARSRRGGN